MSQRFQGGQRPGIVRIGDIVVAGDNEIRDAYICRVLSPARNYSENILCEVLDITAYPIQHAVMHPEIASENPPIMPRAACWLSLIIRLDGFQPHPTQSGRFIQEAEFRARMGTSYYWSSFARCLAEYRRKVEYRLKYQAEHPGAVGYAATDPGELAILDRHAKREFSGRRAVLYEG